MMHDWTDHDLLKAYEHGDTEALAVLVARHQELVRAACARQAPPGDLDDCVQAVFITLSRRPAAARRAPVLVAWLHRVSWYVCSAARRRIRRRSRAERAAAQTDRRDGPLEALTVLDDCLLHLPERQREAITLQYLAGHSPDEVANRMGVSRENAYKLVQRGLDALRQRFARQGFALGGVALVTLLGEQAANAHPPSTAMTGALAPATPAALTLAQGAITSMIIHSSVPLAAAAAILILGAQLTWAAVDGAASQTPPPPASVPASSSDPVAFPPSAEGLPVIDRAGNRVTDPVRIAQLNKALSQMISPDAKGSNGPFIIGYAPELPGEEPSVCEAYPYLEGSGWRGGFSWKKGRWFGQIIYPSNHPRTFTITRWGAKPMSFRVPDATIGIIDAGDLTPEPEIRTAAITATFIRLDEPSVKPTAESAWLRLNGSNPHHEGELDADTVVFSTVPFGEYILEGKFSDGSRVSRGASFIRAGNGAPSAFSVPVISRHTNDIVEALSSLKWMQHGFIYHTGHPGSIQDIRAYKDSKGEPLLRPEELKEFNDNQEGLGYQLRMLIKDKHWIAYAEPLDKEYKARLATSDVQNAIHITVDPAATFTLGRRFDSAWTPVSTNSQVRGE